MKVTPDHSVMLPPFFAHTTMLIVCCEKLINIWSSGSIYLFHALWPNSSWGSFVQSWHLPLRVFSVNLLWWQMTYLHLIRFLVLYFFFSKGSVFNTTQICCCCSENSRSSGILWTILLFLRDQYTCLHTDHFIQFNLTIKDKHLWRTFLASKIIVIFIVNTSAEGCAYDDRKTSYQLTISFRNTLQ